MDLGVSLPTSGPLATPKNIARVAQESERLGYASLWTYERLLRPIAPVPQFGGPPQPVPEFYRLGYEPLEKLPHVAPPTQRVKTRTSALGRPFHPPPGLARAV